MSRGTRPRILLKGSAGKVSTTQTPCGGKLPTKLFCSGMTGEILRRCLPSQRMHGEINEVGRSGEGEIGGLRLI